MIRQEKNELFGHVFNDIDELLTSSLVDDSDNKAVNSEDTSHNAGNQ